MANDLWVSAQGSILGTHCGQLQLTAMRAPPSDEEWLGLLDRKPTGEAALVSLTIMLNDAASTTKQRKIAAERMAHLPPLRGIGILTDSVISRGALVAYGWLAPKETDYRAFRVNETEQALTWAAKLARFERADATARLQALMAAAKKALGRSA